MSGGAEHDCELLVVGAGPAGLAAAITAARLGAEVVVIDRGDEPGGPYPAIGAAGEERWGAPTAAEALLGAGITYVPNSVVWGAFEGRLACTVAGSTYAWYRPRGIILATGALDRPLAFPGWLLPGVIGPAEALDPYADTGIEPGVRAVVAGCSPHLLLVAETLAQAGVPPIAVIQSATPGPAARRDPLFRDQLRDAAEAEKRLRRLGVTVRSGAAVVAAEGHGALERVRVAELDAAGRPQLDRAETYPTDILVVDHGTLPAAELARVLGCTFRFDPVAGAWYPEVDSNLATSVSGVWAAGEVAGLVTDVAAVASGELAGTAAAEWLAPAGRSPRSPVLPAQLAQLRQHVVTLHRFSDSLRAAYAVPSGLWALAAPDTVICECEGVTAGEIAEAVEPWTASTAAVKRWTRAGMGECQGRRCAHMVARLVAQRSGRPLEAVDHPSVRAPITPVPLSVLAEGGAEAPPLPDH